jgi:hypothetical protein
VSLNRGSDPSPADPFGRQGRVQHIRQDVRVGHMGLGTIACPQCDGPVALGPGSVSPAAPLECPFCGHVGRVRDFLTLATPGHPPRPARVQLRVVERGRVRIDPA